MNRSIVNRRGADLHLFVCSMPTRPADIEVLRIRGWEKWPGTYGIGTPNEPHTMGYYRSEYPYKVNRTIKNGDTVSFETPKGGALVWLRGARLVGPWWLSEHPDGKTKAGALPWDSSVMPTEARMVIRPEYADAHMILPLDGLERYVLEHFQGRNRQQFRIPVFGEDGTQSGRGEQIAFALMSALLGGVATALAAKGPTAGAVGGFMLMVGQSLIGTLSLEEQERSPRFDLAEFKSAVQRVLDTRDAEILTVKLVETQDSLNRYREELFERIVLSDRLSDDSREIYFRGPPGPRPASNDPYAVEAFATHNLQWARVIGLVKNLSAEWKWGDEEIEDYRRFVEGATDSNTDGSFAASMVELVSRPEVLRLILPEFMLGTATYASLATEHLALHRRSGLMIVPAQLTAIADRLEAFRNAAARVIEGILNDMHATIDTVKLTKLPERIEVARLFSERYFGDPAVLRDPKLREHIPASAPSFGIKHDYLWQDDAASRGPRIDDFMASTDKIVADLREKAKALRNRKVS